MVMCQSVCSVLLKEECFSSGSAPYIENWSGAQIKVTEHNWMIIVIWHRFDPTRLHLVLFVIFSSCSVCLYHTQRDPPTNKLLSPKSRLLDSNGVWYSSFWSGGPKTTYTWKFVSQNLSPGTSRGGARVLRGSNFFVVFFNFLIFSRLQQSA